MYFQLILILQPFNGNWNWQAGNNPFKRIEHYQTAKKIKNDMYVLLDSFKTFIQSTKNIYGFDINVFNT